MQYMTLIPAYGRDYKTAKDAKAAFEANKDFMVTSGIDDGRYINREQIEPGTTVNIRFKQLRNIAQVKL